ncbi:hypothetical protein BHE74_00052353 [Ensete ventricosum]|nr:hypothetical protein BHE74_00052353 [Ensete ventricosum]
MSQECPEPLGYPGEHLSEGTHVQNLPPNLRRPIPALSLMDENTASQTPTRYWDCSPGGGMGQLDISMEAFHGLVQQVQALTRMIQIIIPLVPRLALLTPPSQAPLPVLDPLQAPPVPHMLPPQSPLSLPPLEQLIPGGLGRAKSRQQPFGCSLSRAIRKLAHVIRVTPTHILYHQTPQICSESNCAMSPDGWTRSKRRYASRRKNIGRARSKDHCSLRKYKISPSP